MMRPMRLSHNYKVPSAFIGVPINKKVKKATFTVLNPPDTDFKARIKECK